MLLSPIQKGQGSGLSLEIVKINYLSRVFSVPLGKIQDIVSNYIFVAPIPFHIYSPMIISSELLTEVLSIGTFMIDYLSFFCL